MKIRNFNEESTKKESFTHKGITVEFDAMPSVKIKSFQTVGETSLFERLAVATGVREFSLDSDWVLHTDGLKFSDKFNGTIKIPYSVSGAYPAPQEIIFDGASIPAPWLISFLTMGILRPLGVMLIGSIVHDFTYQFGYLELKQSDGSFKPIIISRAESDQLFRDLISTVNKMTLIGFIGWIAVRLGWFFGVTYKEEKRGGKGPWDVLFTITLLVITIVAGLILYTQTVAASMIMLYLFCYFAIFINRKRYKNRAS